MATPLFSALAFLALTAVHPHVPKAIVLQGAGGKTTLTWFTVPHNADKVAKLANGADWHLGFAALEVGMPLQSGDVKIPPARYKLDVHRGQDGAFDTLVLTPVELQRARGGRGAPPDPERTAAVEKELQERGIPARIELPVVAVEEPAAEHLEFAVVVRGFETVKNGSAAPKGGARFTLLADFGDLHRKLELVEAFEPKEAAK